MAKVKAQHAHATSHSLGYAVQCGPLHHIMQMRLGIWQEWAEELQNFRMRIMLKHCHSSTKNKS